jgi:hypothetical protein
MNIFLLFEIYLLSLKIVMEKYDLTAVKAFFILVHAVYRQYLYFRNFYILC